MMNINIFSWFTLTNLSSTDRPTLADIIIEIGLPRQLLLALMVLPEQMLLALTILLEPARLLLTGSLGLTSVTLIFSLID